MTTALLFALFPFAMALAATSDLLSMEIPNRIPAALMVGFFVLAPLSGLGLAAMGMHVAVFVAVLALCFGCFCAGWMGGGDAKLIAATALWFGPSLLLFHYVLLASVFGGVLTLLLLQLRRMIMPATGIGILDELLTPPTGVPYGIALGAAGLWLYPSTPFFAAFLARMAG